MFQKSALNIKELNINFPTTASLRRLALKFPKDLKFDVNRVLCSSDRVPSVKHGYSTITVHFNQDCAKSHTCPTEMKGRTTWRMEPIGCL